MTLSGTNAFALRPFVNRIAQEGSLVSGAWLSVDPRHLDDLYVQLKATPRVAGVTANAASIQSFLDTVGENQTQMQSFVIGFAIVIAGGVVYNTARISLSERDRELATMRVLGFTKSRNLCRVAGRTGAADSHRDPHWSGDGIRHGMAFITVHSYRFVPNPSGDLPRDLWSCRYHCALGGCHFGIHRTAKTGSTGLVRSAERAGVSYENFSATCDRDRRCAGQSSTAVTMAMLPRPVAVDLATIQRGPLVVTIADDGRTRIRERYVVSAPLNGRLVRIRLKPGDRVIAHETQLTTIEPPIRHCWILARSRRRRLVLRLQMPD